MTILKYKMVVRNEGFVSTRLRMPPAMHQWVTKRAKQNGRSMNSEILHIIAEKMEEGK